MTCKEEFIDVLNKHYGELNWTREKTEKNSEILSTNLQHECIIKIIKCVTDTYLIHVIFPQNSNIFFEIKDDSTQFISKLYSKIESDIKDKYINDLYKRALNILNNVLEYKHG